MILLTRPITRPAVRPWRVTSLGVLFDQAASDATVDDALVTLPAGQSTTFRVRTSARNLEQALDRPPALRTANDLQRTERARLSE